MAGCGALDEPCETPLPDKPGPAENDTAAVVRSFIARVWNHGWTADEDRQFLQGGDRRYVPAPIAAALDALCAPQAVRHRHDRAGNPVRSSGEDDYRRCVNRVHEVAQDLHLRILDLAVAGDIVTAHIEMTGLDRRADGRQDRTGAFGAPKPTNRRFRLNVAMMYRVSGGKVQEDWLLRRGEPAYEGLGQRSRP